MPISAEERHLQALEDDIRLGESLIGRITALAANARAGGRAERAGEVRRMLATAEGLLEPLYALRSRLRHEGAISRR